MKKLLAIAMCLALMVTSFVTVSAEVDATLTVETVDGPFAEGEEVALVVDITEWENAYGTIALEFIFDDTLLELDAIEQSEFSGALSSTNGNKFSLIASPSSDRAAKKVAGGEICVLYFYALKDITASTEVTVTGKINGYSQGKDDNWVSTQELNVEIIPGGVYVDGPPECTHANTEVRDDAPASCFEDGYTGDTYCLDCGEKIADGETIPATDEHTPEADLDFDENDHWYNCETVGCGNQVQKAPHEGGEATCTAKAECSVCGAEYGDVNAENHVNTEVRDDASADCGNAGYTGDTWCLDCDKMIDEGEDIPATGAHQGGTATCCAKAECDVCGAEYGDFDADNHDGETEVRGASETYTGDTYCLGCDEMIEEGEVIEPNTGKAIVSGGTVKAGEEITVTVSMGENTALGSYTAKLDFDATKLELVSMANGSFCIAVNTETQKASGFSVVNTTSGTFFTATFKAKTDIYGDTSVNVIFEVAAKADRTPVEMTVIPGAIVIECAHEGGEATCTAKAECSVCGAEYGDVNADNHVGETELRDAAPASCYENGYTGDLYCLDCGEVIREGEVIPATGEHAPEADLDFDENDHWYNCETVGCGNQIEKAPHEGGTATCTAKAECSVCGAEYGDFDADNHVGETEVRNAVEADCGNNGYTGDTYCLDCGEMIEEGETIPATGAHQGGEATCCDKAVCDICDQEYGELNAQNHCGETYLDGDVEGDCGNDGYTGDTYCEGCDELLEEGEVIPATGAHTGGEATCVAKAECSVCGEEYGELDAENHEGPAAGSEIQCDEENHWYVCVCGDEVNAEPHFGGEATCVAKAECEICGTPYGEIDEDGHFGGIASCSAKAVCEGCQKEYGEFDLDNHNNTEDRDGDTYCTDCGELVKEKEPAPAPVPTPTDPTVPPNGDASAVGVAGAVCLAAAAAAFVFMKKRG